MRKNIVRPIVEGCEPRNLLNGSPISPMPPVMVAPILPDPSLPPLVPDGSVPIAPTTEPVVPSENPNPYAPLPKWEASPAPSIYTVPDGLDPLPNPVFQDGTLPLPGTPMQDPRVTLPQSPTDTVPPTVLPMPPAGVNTPLPKLPSPDVLAAPPEIDILEPYNPSDGSLHPVREPDILMPPPDGVVHPIQSDPPANVINPLDPANPPYEGLIDT